jgi:hypothetical protein
MRSWVKRIPCWLCELALVAMFLSVCAQAQRKTYYVNCEHEERRGKDKACHLFDRPGDLLDGAHVRSNPNADVTLAKVIVASKVMFSGTVLRLPVEKTATAMTGML